MNVNRRFEIITEKKERATKRLNVRRTVLENAQVSHNEKVAQGLRGCPVRIIKAQWRLENAQITYDIIVDGKI